MVKDTTLGSLTLVPNQTVPAPIFRQEELAQNPRKYSELDTHAALLQLLNSDNSPYASRRDETGISVDPQLEQAGVLSSGGFPVADLAIRQDFGVYHPYFCANSAQVVIDDRGNVCVVYAAGLPYAADPLNHREFRNAEGRVVPVNSGPDARVAAGFAANFLKNNDFSQENLPGLLPLIAEQMSSLRPFSFGDTHLGIVRIGRGTIEAAGVGIRAFMVRRDGSVDELLYPLLMPTGFEGKQFTTIRDLEVNPRAHVNSYKVQRNSDMSPAFLVVTNKDVVEESDFDHICRVGRSFFDEEYTTANLAQLFVNNAKKRAMQRGVKGSLTVCCMKV